MYKEWRSTSKRAEPANGGSQGVGGAKSIIGGVNFVRDCLRHVWVWPLAGSSGMVMSSYSG